MRRVEIIDAVERLRTALTESRLLQTVRQYFKREEPPEEIAGNMLRALRLYNLCAQNFGPAERKLIDIFELKQLEDPEQWLRIIAPHEDRALAYSLHHRLSAVEHYLPKFLALLETDASRVARLVSEPPRPHQEPMGVLSVIIIEEPHRVSRPSRLANALASVVELYEGNAGLMSRPAETLSVLGCDSGGDKSIDFFGLADVMDAVKESILSLWDRIVFHREREMETRINLVAQSLPVIDRVGDLERQGKIGPEEAELIRRKLINGSTKFIESGLTIPEIRTRTSFDPRALLAPQPKLLGTSLPEEEVVGREKEDITADYIKTDTGAERADTTRLSPEERETLERLLRKMQEEGKD